MLKQLTDRQFQLVLTILQGEYLSDQNEGLGRTSDDTKAWARSLGHDVAEVYKGLVQGLKDEGIAL